MKLDIYLNYRGNCDQAFRFYEQHLGGTITGMVRHAESPNPSVAADWKEKILHARIEIGTTVLVGADVSPPNLHSLPLPCACHVDSE